MLVHKNGIALGIRDHEMGRTRRGFVGLHPVGLARERVGEIARMVVATAGAIGVLPASYSVGHSGGELVYVHGATSAYVSPGATVDRSNREETLGRRDDDDKGEDEEP